MNNNVYSISIDIKKDKHLNVKCGLPQKIFISIAIRTKAIEKKEVSYIYIYHVFKRRIYILCDVFSAYSMCVVS